MTPEELVRAAYGNALRKGIAKRAAEHCFDVAAECELRPIKDQDRARRIRSSRSSTTFWKTFRRRLPTGCGKN